MKSLEITKGDTTLSVEKDGNSISIDLGFQDTMDYHTIQMDLSNDERLELIEFLKQGTE